MEQTHCVIKAGGLQETVRKKEGTLLLRKKKVFYQPEQWVVFCVHNEKIPLLEWYDSSESSETHKPIKVHDLLYCMFVNPVFGDDRGFIIGFADEKNSALEFCAPDVEECADWIATLTDKLKELNWLMDGENNYAPFTHSNESPSQSAEEPARQRPTTILLDNGQYPTSPELCRQTSTVPIAPRIPPPIDTLPRSPPVSPPPPLPPRPSNTLTRTRTLLTDEIPMQSAGLANHHRGARVNNEYVADFSADPSRTAGQTLSQSVKETPTMMTMEGATSRLADVSASLKNLSCSTDVSLVPSSCLSAPSADRLPLTTTISSPLQVISRRIQYQHQQLQLSMEIQPQSGSVREVLPPLPPRKSLQDHEMNSGSGTALTAATEETGENGGVGKPSPTQNIYDMGSGKNGEQYDCLPVSPSAAAAANYDILSAAGLGRGELHEQISLDLNNVVVSSSSHLSELTSTYSEESASSSSCKMRMSGLSSPVYSSRASSSSESRRSAPSATAAVPIAPPVSSDYIASPPSLEFGGTAAAAPIPITRAKAREQYDFPTSPPLTIPTTYSAVFREALSKPRTISLSLAICVEHMAFVEVGGKIWIAGWTQDADTLFKECMINFGDEVVQIGDQPVKSMEQLMAAFYSQAIPGAPISVRIRSIPHGSVYSLTKSLNPKQSLGIQLEKKKNRISAIEEKSPAWNAQVPARVQPFIYAGGVKDTAAVLTQINGVPLNPFAKDEQFAHRVKSIPLGSSFNVIVHPLDFVKLIKAQLKANKCHKKFLHAN